MWLSVWTGDESLRFAYDDGGAGTGTGERTMRLSELRRCVWYTVLGAPPQLTAYVTDSSNVKLILPDGRELNAMLPPHMKVRRRVRLACCV